MAFVSALRGRLNRGRDMDDWMAHMRRGDLAAAWAVNDADLAARAAAGHPPVWHRPRHLQPVWDGSPVAGRRVLVRCYHGLGDTVQFVRFCRPLRAVAAEVIVWCQPSLCDLVATADGVDRVMPLHDGTPDVEYDVDVEVMELPHVLRAGTVATAVPYLHVAPKPASEVLRRPGPPGSRPGLRSTSDAGLDDRSPTPKRVGLVWQSGDWDDRRSIPPALLSDAFAGVPVDWLVLQRGADPLPFGTGVESDDATATAAVMRSLDVLVTVDSFPAHLGGALGVPTWTLLHADADWRWMTGRDDSPWYPTMRLFRQAVAGDWRPVLARVAAGLRELL